MFYSENISEGYRMGDIVTNFYDIIPNFANNSNNLNIQIEKYKYFVILTPCCSIEKKEAIIVPLKEIEGSFLMSNYLLDNFLIINEPMLKIESMGDNIFSKQPPEKQQMYNLLPKTYEFVDKFIYDKHEFLDKYHKSYKGIEIETSMYMISFKDSVRVKTERFERGFKNCEKTLELSPLSRDILRKKLVHFYGRIPMEDQEFLIS